MNNYCDKITIPLVIVFGLLLFNARCLAEDVLIEINFNKYISEVDKKVFGNNVIAYDPKTYERNYQGEYYGFSDYGAGVWDPKWSKPVKRVIDLAKEAGITILRFPGGCGTHHYNWKDTIGKEREHFLYGIDEFLKTCEEIGAEAIITVSYFTGDEKDAADLVEYLNCPNDGAHRWATERERNGHSDPYDVKYFEIGNEVMHGNHRDIKNILPEEYAYRYLKYYDAMKVVDHSIKIGVVLHTSNWNRKVLDIVRDKLDFGIIHTYPSPEVSRNKLETMDSKDVFGISLAMPVLREEYVFQETLNLLHEKSGRDIPLAITEYNGGFVQEKPVPYRHCLGTALLNAELLRIFMKLEHNILMANYWNFNNGYTGMIKSEVDFMNCSYRFPINYTKRPNYYVYELYYKHFGNILLEASVLSPNYDIDKFRIDAKTLNQLPLNGNIEGPDLLLEAKWVSKPLEGVIVKEDNDILYVEFRKPSQGNYYHTVKTTQIEPNTMYMVSGFIKTDDLEDSEGVCLEVQDIRGWEVTHFAVRTERIKGTTDWIYLEQFFATLSDTKGLKIIARRNSNEVPFEGKAYFRDIKLHKYDINLSVPYLSVNVSKDMDDSKVYLMVINKRMDEKVTSIIDLRGFIPAKKANAWILNGPTIDATNEKKWDNVKVVHKEFEIKDNHFKYTFEPHSLTAIEVGSRI